MRNDPNETWAGALRSRRERPLKDRERPIAVSKMLRRCWRNRSLRGQRGEARDACGSKWATGEPCRKAVNVDRRSCCHVLQVCLGQPAVARPSQAECAGRLRNRALDALALGVELAAGLVPQARPCRREGLVLLARMQG